MDLYARGLSGGSAVRRWASFRWRGVVAVAIVVAAGLSGCGSSPQHSAHIVALKAVAAHPSPSGSARPSGSGSPSSKAPVTASPSAPATPSRDAGPAQEYLPRIPSFAPLPDPEPVVGLPGPHVPWLSRIPTQQPVAFITIDDGWTKLPVAPALLRAAHVPVTLFLSTNAIQDDPGYFKALQASGAVIEAHTLTHSNLKGKGYAAQQHEICGSADQLAGWYGRRPVLFRPPFGDQDATTLKAVHDCDMRAAFFWSETVDKGVVRYQTGHQIQPGDIILMHFRPAFAEDFLAALNAIHDSGLTPALLEDYIA